MIDDSDFRLADRPTLHVFEVGRERERVAVIDNVMRNPAALVEFAATQVSFGENGVSAGAYPGIGAPAPLDYAKPLAQAVEQTIRNVFGIGTAHLVQARCRLSLVTTSPEALQPLQRIPHIDTTDTMQFALLHYLCSDRFGGTAFFRHRATGFETITKARVQHYNEVRTSELKSSLPAPGYFDRDTNSYERIGDVTARFDRLIIYRSCLLHSGLIPDATHLSENPREGRLTVNMFLTYAPESRTQVA